MSRSVGHHEVAAIGREVAIGNVDRDALLAFCRKSVDEQREVEFVALGANPFRVGLQGGEMVVEDEVRFVEQSSDEGGLSVVDAAADDESEQPVVFVGVEVGIDVGLDQFLGGAGDQK